MSLAIRILACAALSLFTASATSAAQLEWQNWTYITHDSTHLAIAGQRASLEVPENPAQPHGARVRLEVMRLPATTATPGIPVVYLHGGPGGSSAEHLEQPEFRALFDSLRTRGDVVMFDQRGCGASTPSLVPIHAPRMRERTLASRDSFLTYFEQVSTLVRDGLTRAGHDPRQYDLRNSVEDVEALRAALGVARLDLLAHSYGTQLAQAYARAHPAGVERMVLIGARGMDTARKLPADADAFLGRVAELARQDSTVGARVPDLLATLDRVLTRLDREPLAFEMRGNQQTFTLAVGGYALRFIIAKFYLNDPDNFRFLPKLLDEIDTGRRPWSLGFNLGQMLRGGVSFAWLTTDAATGATPARLERIAAEAKTARLQDAMNFPFPDINAVWAMADLGDAFRAPVRSDAPTLLIAGTLDGITPVAQSAEIAQGFSHAARIVVENGGHTSQLRAPGLCTAIAKFYDGVAPPASLEIPRVEFRPLVTGGSAAPAAGGH